MQTAPHNQELIRRLKNVAAQIEMAIEDAESDFHEGIAHAEIALTTLKITVDLGRKAKAA